MFDKEMYSMELNEEIEIGIDKHVQRVPGGWIYTSRWHYAKHSTAIFVPFNDEFNLGKKDE